MWTDSTAVENTDTACPVVYGLDVGVYNLGVKSQILSSTTTAWCRLSSPPTSLAEVEYSGTALSGQFHLFGGWSASCGRSIEHLALRMACDFTEGKSIALGFEAPMWFPFYSKHRQSLSLFSPRFPEEAGHAWYLQAGAAATLKAISLGCLLFSQLEESGLRMVPSTEPASWRLGTGSLLLFEAFVAGDYKLGRPTGVPEAAANEWDAAIVALSWFYAHGFPSEDLTAQPRTLHEAGSQVGSVISVWSIILGACVKPVNIQGPPDCEIVAMLA